MFKDEIQRDLERALDAVDEGIAIAINRVKARHPGREAVNEVGDEFNQIWVECRAGVSACFSSGLEISKIKQLIKISDGKRKLHPIYYPDGLHGEPEGHEIARRLLEQSNWNIDDADRRLGELLSGIERQLAVDFEQKAVDRGLVYDLRRDKSRELLEKNGWNVETALE